MTGPSMVAPENGAKSLRANFAATLASNVVFAACQWAVLSLITKLGGARMLGEYAYALALVTPIAMLSHLNLRSVLATDVEHRHPFGDYLAVRLATTAVGVAAMLGLAAMAGRGWNGAALIVLLGISLSADNVSDLCYGVLQRRERMDQVAYSVIARGLLPVIGLGLALRLTGSLVWAAAALALGRLAVLAAYDLPVGSRRESLRRTGRASQAGILRTALPLGAVLMLIALTTSLPRYVIEGRLGSAELGAFAAAASFMTVGSTAVNSLGQAATPRLARYFSGRDFQAFRRLAGQLTMISALLGVCGVVTAAVLGPWVLRLVYRPAFAAYGGLLVWMMVAAAVNYTGAALGYVITSARSFAAQAPLQAAVVASVGIASFMLVPRMGLYGAALALGIAYAVQIAGELLILGSALRSVEAAA